MKKILVLLVVVLCAVNIKAQTYEGGQVNLSNQIRCLNLSLNSIKDRIYYLKVELPGILQEDSLLKAQNKKSRFNSDELKQLKKEKFFASEDLINLDGRKDSVIQALKKLRVISLSAAESQAQLDTKSIPERISQYEYKQRVRSQMLKTSSEDKPIMYPGLLVNYKNGRNEIAVFTITRIGFPEFSPIVESLNPEERLYVSLPAGDYRVDVRCGSFRGVTFPRVRENEMKHCDGQQIYWFACKLMSDR